uniref:ZP domain-containing protein n=1 Tax=Rhabditophanes sp. KR3021 TaxID=114890 RepID=A0AC35TH79_9BILA
MLINMNLKVLFILFTLINCFLATSIDNEIIGEPDIECLQDEIKVWVKTRKPFTGRIYAKGNSELPECIKEDFTSAKTKKPHFSLSFGSCGMQNFRSTQPRGMYYGITVIVSFHPILVTSVDQAYHAKCFFEEASTSVNAELGVSEMAISEIEARHGIAGCTYSMHSSSIDQIESGKPVGPAIQHARIGQKVLHQWHCDDQIFGMLLHNCYVTDGIKHRIDVIDESGCPLDPLIVSGIKYSEDLQRAYAETQTFKFADSPAVWFNCRIQSCIKNNGHCAGITPPVCGSKTPLEDKSSDQYPTYKKNSDLVINKLNNLRKQSSDYQDPTYDYDAANLKNNKKAIFDAPPTPTVLTEFDEDLLRQPANNPKIEGTPFTPPQVMRGAVVRQKEVTAKYETRNDLPPNDQEFGPLTSIHGERLSSYKSAEVTESNNDKMVAMGVPTHVRDLIKKLSNDIDPENLQHIFQNSYNDKDALLKKMRGVLTKIQEDKSVESKENNSEVSNAIKLFKRKRLGRKQTNPLLTNTLSDDDMNSRLARDSPLKMESSALKSFSKDEDDVPEISGQLLVYDLDEEPKVSPVLSQDTKAELDVCVVSSASLSTLGLVATVIALLFIFVIIHQQLRLHRSELERTKLLKKSPMKDINALCRS